MYNSTVGVLAPPCARTNPPTTTTTTNNNNNNDNDNDNDNYFSNDNNDNNDNRWPRPAWGPTHHAHDYY